MALLFEIDDAEQRRKLAEQIVSVQYESFPDLPDRYGPGGREHCVSDVVFNLLYLEAAVGSDSPSIFHEYVGWLKILFARLGIDERDLIESLRAMRRVLAGRGEPGGDKAAALIDEAIAALPRMPAAPASHIVAEHPLGSLARSYLDALLAGDRRAATGLVIEAARAGTPVPELYLGVFQPCLREVGRLWQLNRISVAQEHLFTAATQMIMSQLYPFIFDRPGNGRRLLAACANGELHEIGVRMVADLFELDGWETTYVGASSPIAATVALAVERRPDLICVSATIAPNVAHAQALIAALRARPELERARILAGGRPFDQAPELWRRIGADGWAANAVDAVRLGRELVRP